MRRKVGEFHALNKMYNGEAMLVWLKAPKFEAFADNLVEFFGPKNATDENV